MVIDLRGVSTENPNEWIVPVRRADGSFEEKEYLLKIVSIDDTKFNKNGDQTLEVTFRTADNKLYKETFSLGETALWKLKQFTVELKAPEYFDIFNLIGRYIVAVISGREYNGKIYNQTVSWRYATQNDKLPPIVDQLANADEAEELF